MELLIRRYEQDLLGFLTRLMGNRTSAEDVFQDTFIQIHQSLYQFDTTRRFKPWLFTIAANKGRDYFRKHGRHAAMADLSAPVGGKNGDGATFIDLLKADIPEHDEKLNQAELREQIRHAIDTMPHHLKEILLLAYFQKLSYNRISESLEIPLGTVKSRLHTAVATFAAEWKRQQGSEAELFV